MSNENLSLKVDPFRLAKQAVRLQGILKIKDMERLCTGLPSTEGEVIVDACFGIDRQGIHFLQSHIETQIKLQCQRCMELFNYSVIDDVLMGIVTNETEALQLPERYDPVLATEGALIIQDVVEDELILSLPIVPRHDPKDCTVLLPNYLAKSQQEVVIEKENPFKVIELLKHKTKGKTDLSD